MRTAFHITSFYDETKFAHLNNVIEGLNKIPGDNRIFIYSNKNLKPHVNDSKGNITFIKYFYSLSILEPLYKKFGKYPHNHWTRRRLGVTLFTHPYYLSWESRSIMEKIVEDFDVQMYMEDDVLFTDTHFKFWQENKDLCLKHDYNLGFMIYEVDEKTGQIFYVGLTETITKVVNIEGKAFVLNDNNPYVTFWLMDKQELKNFIKSPEWRFEVGGYDERAIAAVGWHGLNMSRYKGTLVPLIPTAQSTYQPLPESLVHHLPNKYIGHHMFSKIKHPLTFHLPEGS